MIFSPRQADLLVEIYTDPGRGLRHYAGRLGITYRGALEHLQPLLAGGWVRRSRDLLHRQPWERRPEYHLHPDAFPATVTICGERCRLVLLDPPPGAP